MGVGARSRSKIDPPKEEGVKEADEIEKSELVPKGGGDNDFQVFENSAFRFPPPPYSISGIGVPFSMFDFSVFHTHIDHGT